MSTATVPALITAEQFAEMNLDGPYELVCGEIVEMTRPGGLHGFVCMKVGARLNAWAESTDFGCVICNDVGVVTKPKSVRGPDVILIPWSRLPGRRLPSGWFENPPVLVVEVLSPTDRWNAMLAKAGEYHDAGVDEVWVINPSTRMVTIFDADADPSQFSADALLTSRHLPGFECSVAALFPPEGGA